MFWDPELTLEDFKVVARLAGNDFPISSIVIEKLPAPHKSPTNLPSGKMAVYVFSYGEKVLKVGKVGANSQARYVSQHYNAASSQSNLAASILADQINFGMLNIEHNAVGGWIRQHTDRVNFLLDGSLGIPLLTLLEAYLCCRLNPRYEGFKSQRSEA